MIKSQRTIVARLAREIERKSITREQTVSDALKGLLGKARQIVAQSTSRRNKGEGAKLYAWHAPEVECIAKGKSRTPYEFGVKVGIAATLKHNLIVGARSFAGKPYDGHTLNEQLEQAEILMQDTGQRPQTAYVDLGYRGVDADNPGVAIKHRGKFKTLSASERKLLKRRQAIEPIIGHLKADHRMGRCYLKGEKGDSLNAVLSAAGYNIRWLLRMIASRGLAFLHKLYLRLCEAAATRPHWLRELRALVLFVPIRPRAQLLGA
jgi:IS5 family transposase